MPVNLAAPNPLELYPIAGVRIGVTEAGIRKVNRKDLTVVLIDEGASVAGSFHAEPVLRRTGAGLSRASWRARANPFGPWSSTLAMPTRALEPMAWPVPGRPVRHWRSRQGVRAQQVLPFSTGVIMETLPVERIEAGLDAAIADARADHWLRAAEAIMTTDTAPKAFGAQLMLDGKLVSITGISKGAGMIRPNMATMLGFMATDACVAPALMKQLATELAEGSFNRVTVDGDTSTNDSFVVIATHRAGHPTIDSLDNPAGQALRTAMLGVAQTTGSSHCQGRGGCYQIH
jgi:glutamate N-acetyltransferase/amino-acid N-acetyltransferase